MTDFLGFLGAFDHRPGRVVFGPDAVDRVGEVTREIGARKVLLVTDPGLVAAGHAARVRGLLEEADLEVSVFDALHPNPTTRDVEACLKVSQSSTIDAFVALGGGSSLDTAKGCNFLLTNGGRMEDYWGVGKATKPLLPLVAVPTTAGTGSECQSFALIAREDNHMKMACGDPKAMPGVAVLDPLLTVTQPAEVTASAGLDAVVHGVETAVTRRRNSLSLLYARESFRRTQASLPEVIRSPDSIEARGNMLLGASFAGMAIENSMLGAAHSAANPLSARFDVIHGFAVALMLPAVVRFNAEDAATERLYAELAAYAGLVPAPVPEAQAVAALVERLVLLQEVTGIPRSLRDYGLAQADLPRLAEEAAQQWTAQFNPRPVSAADFQQLYEAVFEG